MQRVMLRRFSGVFGLVLLAGTGCGERTAKVSGQVFYQDKPVPGGTVMFKPVAAGRAIATANLDEEGRYEVTVAVGEVQILVDNRQLAPVTDRPPAPTMPKDFKAPGGKPEEKAPAQKSPAPPRSGRYREIPPKYYQFETSGLDYTVQPEPQVYKIELK